MNKKTIIESIQDARDFHLKWLEQAKLLVEGGPIGSIQEPLACTECQFGIWFYSDGQILNTFPWFKEIEEVHKKFHDSYKRVYEEAQRIVNPTSTEDLKHYYSELKNQSNFLIEKLSMIDEAIKEMPENSFKTDGLPTNGYNKPKDLVPDHLDKLVVNVDSEQTGMHLNLIQQDIHRLEEEQQLTKLELKQLIDRKNLTNKAIEQIEQYKQLKNSEINQKLSSYHKLEKDNSEVQESEYSNLDELKKLIQLKCDELEHLKLVDLKLEQRKTIELKKEQKIRDDFEQQQYVDKQDLIELQQQCGQWQNEVKKLKQQVSLIEQDIDSITIRAEAKKDIISSSNKRKDSLLEELNEELQQQEVLHGHKMKVKEVKQDELQQLEQEKSLKEEKLHQLDLESEILRDKKLKVSRVAEEELDLLEEQQLVKKKSIEKLNEAKQQKHQELKDLNSQRDMLGKSLNTLSKQQETKELFVEKV